MGSFTLTVGFKYFKNVHAKYGDDNLYLALALDTRNSTLDESLFYNLLERNQISVFAFHRLLADIQMGVLVYLAISCSTELPIMSLANLF